MSLRLIIIVVILIIAIIFGFIVVWPKFQDYQQLQSDVAQKETELNSKTEYYFKIKEIWEKLKEYEDVLSQIDAALPSGYSVPALSHYLQQTAGETDLVLGNLTFKSASGDKVKEIGINLQVSGTYSALKNFISALENSSRFFKVKSIGFSSPQKESGLFTFDLGITTYSY